MKLGMPITIKIILSTFVALICFGILFINPSTNNAGPDWFWMGGKNDPFRNLLCKSDGTLRAYVKPVFILFCLIFIWLIWQIE